jgi:hypothetical protein
MQTAFLPTLPETKRDTILKHFYAQVTFLKLFNRRKSIEPVNLIMLLEI